jgi:hypothetical protein
MTRCLPRVRRQRPNVAPMVRHVLFGSVVWLTASALSAQYFVSVGSEPRRTTRAAWIGMSGEQSVSVEYGQPEWRAEHDRFLNERAATPLLLGRGALTTVRTDVELTFGAQKLARGRWYVGARRDDRKEWTLALFAADRVDASAGGATAILSTEPDLRVPVRWSSDAEVVERFDISLTDDKRTARGFELALAWGPYRMRVNFTAAFDDRKPEGAPDFATTPAGKGTTTASGLSYQQLRAGTGARPGPKDKVRVHYAAWLADGTLFDSSHLRGEPFTMEPEWVVKGFAEGLQLMQPGSIYRLTIPPDLAYGERGAGDRVPPNSTLVFVVTLLGIEKT